MTFLLQKNNGLIVTKDGEVMTINFEGYEFMFRGCDTVGMTEEDLERAANNTGRIQYDPGCTWLLVPGVGYGWLVAC